MKSELIARLEELLSKDAVEVAADVKAIQKEYQKLWTSEFEQAKQAFLDEGGHLRDFEYHKGAEDQKFEALIEQYGKLKKEADAKLASTQARNLIIKEEIIAKIKDLSHVSENVGAAIRKLQELQAQWKETGQISSHKYKDVQADYSRAVEEFYYNLKIFRDLQEHDLKKNYELKSELIQKLKAIQQLENVKEAERLIKIYRNEWDEIGPVPNSKWDSLKQEYKTALDETYSKIKSHYHSLEEQKEANLKTKKQIIEQARALVEASNSTRAQQWNEATEKLLALQAEWKNTGRTSEKDNEKVWSEFRSVCDSFFEKKKEFFAGLNEKFAANRKVKSELIAKAEALQDSIDWQKTTADLIKLQESWKKHPANGDKEEAKLFARFRRACNHFFEAKKKHYEDVDASYEKNLAAKEEILKKLNDLKLGEDINSNREQLRAITLEWNEAGHVPMKEKKRVNEAFYNRLDELYEQMHIDKHEKAQLQFRAKIDRLVSADNAQELLRREADHLRKLSEEINARVRTYDNNMGFFKASKGNNSFMKEIEDKIKAEKERIEELAGKRKMVNEALGKLREADKPRAAASH